MSFQSPASTILTTNPSNDWQIVLRQPTGKVVLYHSPSNQFSVHSSHPNHHQSVNQSNHQDIHHNDNSVLISTNSSSTSNSKLIYQSSTRTYCPFCLQPLNLISNPKRSIKPNHQSISNSASASSSSLSSLSSSSSSPTQSSSKLNVLNQTDLYSINSTNRTITKHSYFRLLSQSNTPIQSQPISPSEINPSSFKPNPQSEPLGNEKRVDGYYDRFFVEEMKLGRGQKGSVFLCTHVLDGNALGHYAVKKIAVGQSSPELLHVLSEVKFLESLRHRNITQYHHAWIEKAQLSRFGPRVPVLYILMDYANGGTLDDYINLRKGSNFNQKTTFSSSQIDEDSQRRKNEKEKFRKMKFSQHLSAQADSITVCDSTSSWNILNSSSQSIKSVDLAVHLLGLEEILNVFEDTCRGLGFLHSKGILHHDLKTENVLLHWESDDAMIPTALISDFGSSVSQSENWRRERTGRTGTLDWAPPESLKKDPKTGKLFEVTQKGDIWQLGLVLHCLCFLRLPYNESDDIDRLVDEINHYPGFLVEALERDLKQNLVVESGQVRYMNRSDLPHSLLRLLSNLLCLDPRLRPSCDRILVYIQNIRQSSLGQNYIESLSRQNKSLNRLSHNPVVISEKSQVDISNPSALVKRRKNFPSQSSYTAKKNFVGDDQDSKPINDPLSKMSRPKTILTSSSRRFINQFKLVNSQTIQLGENAPVPKLLIYLPKITVSLDLKTAIGIEICLKSFVATIKLQNHNSSLLVSNYGILILTILNTLEILICKLNFSILLTLLEIFVLIGLKMIQFVKIK
ncbi:hypothetical protein O181_026856 [Austropuccinia psidii MF-1]|uniref:non-specific serine/threonine protein kinase n=1 Tax=Austropuccinia psidii MF-1 TaxID=1389203 RepID=A0A9Q3CL73_9BASI|nr:hypothetical protein [Austropuccinia psidii MF-1]